MPTRVTPDNFNRAESDMYFSSIVHDGGFGPFHHNRTLMPIDDQTVIRSNRDTLYSAAVFDLDAGPVTITLPDAGTRFISMQLIDEEQFAPVVVYEAAATRSTASRSALAMSWRPSASSSIPATPRISIRFTRCRMRSRSASAGPARSKSRRGIR